VARVPGVCILRYSGIVVIIVFGIQLGLGGHFEFFGRKRTV
jgi:hypothetical protein